MQSTIPRAFLKTLKTSLASTTRRRALKSECFQNLTSYFSRRPAISLNRPLSLPSKICSRTHCTRRFSTQTTDIVFPDPNRPDLFYHLVHAPTPLSKTLPAFALSFLDKTPPSVDSPAVIGWLPAQTYEADTPTKPENNEREAGLNDFVQNNAFMKLLHETIKAGLTEGVDKLWKDQAMGLQSGWMHIHDQRNIPPLDRIGDPDDIIATVLVQDSKILVETYQPMPAYRVCTVDGVMQLTPGLANYLKTKLLDLASSGSAS